MGFLLLKLFSEEGPRIHVFSKRFFRCFQDPSCWEGRNPTLENPKQPFRKKQLSMQATLPKTSRSVGTSLHAKGVTVNQLEVRAILEKSGIALIAQHLNLNTLEWKK